MFALLYIASFLGVMCADVTSNIPVGDGRPLIHGGNVTSPTSVPWHAGIWKPVGAIYSHECGGTLIAPNLIVTAAHCFWNYTTRQVIPNLHSYQVALGKIYREWHLDSSSPSVQRMNIQSVILDSRFDGYYRRNLENDIALVVLTNNATLTDHVQVAAIDAGTPANGSVGVVAGWGYDETGNLSHELRSIQLPYVDHDTCYQSLGADKFKRLLTSDKFCAGYINQGKSVCQGDSGGGFITLDKVTKKPTVRGIVSIDFRPKEFPKDRCYSLFYTAFTNIGEPRYIQWIREHIASATTLHIYQRDDWSARPEDDSVPLVTPVPYVMIAHTVTSSCDDLDDCGALVRAAQDLHMGYDWGDIGYNFLVGGDGYVYVGRGWENMGAHTLGYNTCSIGIAFIGTFTSAHPPPQQLDAALLLIAEGVRLGKIRPDYRLLAQRQITQTESPGSALFADLKKLPHFSRKLLSCATVVADMNAG